MSTEEQTKKYSAFKTKKKGKKLTRFSTLTSLLQVQAIDTSKVLIKNRQQLSIPLVQRVSSFRCQLSNKQLYIVQRKSENANITDRARFIETW